MQTEVQAVAAVPRPSPYINVSWLARIMAGDPCHWQRWFLVYNRLTTRAREFDGSEWTVRHTRLLTDLSNEILAAHLTPDVEYELSIPIGKSGAQLHGRIDCLVVDEQAQLATVYECKTGDPKNRDRIQTMLYMHFLLQRPRFRGLGMKGVLVYPDHRDTVERFPSDFADNVKFFLDLLLAETPPRKSPGFECRDCSITKVDCPERVEGESE
jgi:hypothetical protein